MNDIVAVTDVLDELHIAYELVHHGAVYTIEEMERLDLPHGEAVAKNLFLRDNKGRNHYLVVVPKHKTVKVKELRSQLGCSNLSFASEERLQRYLGLEKGAVTPLGILNDGERAVQVVFDRDLESAGIVGVHPNRNTATVFLSFADLKRVVEWHGNPVTFATV